jgi:hypothetical protein
VLTPEHRGAVLWVAGVALGNLLLLAGADIALTWTGRLPVGAWVTRWVQRYPLYAMALVLVTGALIGHFFYATG